VRTICIPESLDGLKALSLELGLRESAEAGLESEAADEPSTSLFSDCDRERDREPVRNE
jgi:hypothetical protein